MATFEPIPNTAGVILAGGASSRFGSNKALALCHGEPLVARAAKVLASLFSELLLVTNTPATYEFLGWPMVSDSYQQAGPLAGIHAALTAIQADRALVVACDMPYLNAPLIRHLCQVGGAWDVVLPRLDTGREPLHAIYAKSCRPAIERHLDAGQRKIGRLLDDLKVHEVRQREILAMAPDLTPFHNVNQPADLEQHLETSIAPLTLRQAQLLVLRHVKPVATEQVVLADAVGRITNAPLRACLAVPGFRQSTRDGYALRSDDIKTASSGNSILLPVSGEIAAGDTTPHRLTPGQAWRIMTGGLVPAGADAVLPFEQVEAKGPAITLHRPAVAGAHIRPPDTDCRAGQILLGTGQPITPRHLALLAPAGVRTISVSARPRVGFLCTGSELADDSDALLPGQVISGNRPLLQALLHQCGATPVDLGAVPDTLAALTAAITQAREAQLDMLITTGGMGPGKYDIVQRALHELGAHILYRSLMVRPGKATLAAILDGLLFFGLPGPPPAVHLLFHELVLPAIRRAVGMRPATLPAVKARLEEPVTVRQRGVLHLKEALLTSRNGLLVARLPRANEAPNAILLIPANRRTLPAGAPASLHPLAP